MLGALLGDWCGARYESRHHRMIDFNTELLLDDNSFTDDTVMTLATAEAILNGETTEDGFARSYLNWGRRYPHAGYGHSFRNWLDDNVLRHNDSFGNGSAMRVSPVGWAADSLEEALEMARCTAAITHGHPEGIKGAQEIAGSIFLLRTGCSKRELKEWLENKFGCRSPMTISELHQNPHFDASCQGSVPQAIEAFLEAADFDQALRKAYWIGGDADTQGDMAGAMAEAFWGVPDRYRVFVENALSNPKDNIRYNAIELSRDIKSIVQKFESRFGPHDRSRGNVTINACCLPG